jgi:2-aminomuconate deaminase
MLDSRTSPSVARRLLIKSQFTMNDGAHDSQRAPEPVGPYPHARRVGGLLFLSGVGPRERGSKAIPGVELDAGGEIVSYDIAAQCHSVFNNVRKIVEDAGSSWENIVDVTVFLTNMKDDFEVYNRIYAEYFADNRPCRTTVEVGALPTPIAIELKVIAIIRENK